MGARTGRTHRHKMNTITPSQMSTFFGGLNPDERMLWMKEGFAALPKEEQKGFLTSTITALPKEEKLTVVNDTFTELTQEEKVTFVTKVFTESANATKDAFNKLGYVDQTSFLQSMTMDNRVIGFNPALKTQLEANMAAFKGSPNAVKDLMKCVIDSLETDAVTIFINQLRGDRTVYDVTKAVLPKTNAAHTARGWGQVLEVLEEDHLTHYRSKIVEAHQQIALKTDQKAAAEEMLEQVQNSKKCAQNCAAKGMDADPVETHVSNAIESGSDQQLALQDSGTSDAMAPVSAEPDAMALVSVEPEAEGDKKEVDQSKAHTVSEVHWRRQVSLLHHQIEKLKAEIKTHLQNIKVIEDVFKAAMGTSFRKSWTEWAEEWKETIASPITGAKRRCEELYNKYVGGNDAKKAKPDEAK